MPRSPMIIASFCSVWYTTDGLDTLRRHGLVGVDLYDNNTRGFSSRGTELNDYPAEEQTIVRIYLLVSKTTTRYQVPGFNILSFEGKDLAADIFRVMNDYACTRYLARINNINLILIGCLRRNLVG